MPRVSTTDSLGRVMRILLAWLLLSTTGLAVSPAQLELLKSQFPKHTAGPMSEQTPPEIALLYFRYKYNVGRMNPDSIDVQFEALRDEMKADLKSIELDETIGNATNEGKQNSVWLKTRVRPWIMKLEAMIVTPLENQRSPTPPRR